MHRGIITHRQLLPLPRSLFCLRRYRGGEFSLRFHRASNPKSPKPCAFTIGTLVFPIDRCASVWPVRFREPPVREPWGTRCLVGIWVCSAEEQPRTTVHL